MPTTRKRDTQPTIVHTRNTRSRLSTSTSTSTSTTPNSRSKSPEKKEVKMTIPVLSRERPVDRGVKAWERDFRVLKSKWKKGKIEGYGGLIAEISDFKSGDAEHSARFKLSYEDMDGRASSFTLEMAFNDLTTYPQQYSLLCFSDDTLPRRASRTFTHFSKILGLDINGVVTALVASLQGDDEIDGGANGMLSDVGGQGSSDEEEEEWEGEEPESQDYVPMTSGAGSSKSGAGMDWDLLKIHFEEAKTYGYRPGLTAVSDHWVISYSIPFKNIDIDPNTLCMWDDGLVEAWRTDQRFTLLITTDQYPPHLDHVKYSLGYGPNYKPSLETIYNSVRTLSASIGTGSQLEPFYLSAPLSNYLKSFARCYKLRTGFQLNWQEADGIGMDEIQSNRVFVDNWHPPISQEWDEEDPVVKGYERNLPLVAFWWCLRRFTEATKYCLNCGTAVGIPSLRPYVCDKPLCLYGFMSLGLGPSVEHVIQSQPGVVDLLVSLAYSAARSKTRMTMPLGLHIELPDGTLLDTAPDQANALADLIDTIPLISHIKAHLDSGSKLKDLDASSGAITVLRWIVGSCRAYLKETKPGEGVLNAIGSVRTPGVVEAGVVRQFTFVVGSPEQEDNFRQEIVKARGEKPSIEQYPTLLAFHGSATERWHNILRTGLDFNETVCGRACVVLFIHHAQERLTDSYGHGVYFGAESSTSMGGYARATMFPRQQADFPIQKATALVELVNAPEKFVSNNPHYVVSNLKQMKPFLLLVIGKGEPVEANESKGRLFQHDPALRIKTTYDHQPLRVTMPEQLVKVAFDDPELDDETDSKLLKPPAPTFIPSPPERFRRLNLMPPPTETSSVASKALQKEFKNLIKLQNENALPFYIDPGTDSLYCWVMELFEFPESKLKEDMKRLKVKSLLTEVRFPASFPHSPPFMRILHPRCLTFIAGGGGNITAGGSICNEILTASGWNPAYCVEAMVRDIMTNMTEATPPARLDPHRWDSAYTLPEAVEAFKRVAGQHGWAVPRDFDKMSR